MKIASIVDRFPALSETFILNQITGLIDRGHDVSIVARGAREEVHHPDVVAYKLQDRTLYWPNLPSSRVGRWGKGLALLAREGLKRPGTALASANMLRYGRHAATMNLAYAVRSLAGRRHFDVVHCHFGDNGLLGMALSEMGVIEGQLVTSFYGYDLSSYLTTAGDRAYSRLARAGALFLPVSEVFRQKLVQLGFDGAKVVVHRMGIDTSRFTFRARIPPSDGVLRLVSVSRLVEKKGIEFAIRAVAQLARAGRRLVYTVIGDGPLRPRLEQLVGDLGQEAAVHLVGSRPQPEIIRLLDEAHLAVAPSVVASDGDVEGTPAVIMEAMAMGLPVVATRHSGIPELVEDGVSGRLVPERDVDALAQAIAELADNPDQWPRMGQAGRNKVLEQHDIDRLNDSLVALYERVLATGP